MRLDICQQSLDPYGKGHDFFLDRIITADETWIHPCEVESNPARESSKANHLQEN
jgi:hypothetical protein